MPKDMLRDWCFCGRVTPTQNAQRILKWHDAIRDGLLNLSDGPLKGLGLSEGESERRKA